jgi:hypothetical protein
MELLIKIAAIQRGNSKSNIKPWGDMQCYVEWKIMMEAVA